MRKMCKARQSAKRVKRGDTQRSVSLEMRDGQAGYGKGAVSPISQAATVLANRILLNFGTFIYLRQ